MVFNKLSCCKSALTRKEPVLNIAVCDDEMNIRNYLKKLIEQQKQDCRIVEFSSGEELLQFWRREDRERIDLLFLDISMEGSDGMETAAQIRSWKEEREEPLWGGLPLLIFVTGYPEYMPKAFSVNAFQFLVKPISEREFEAVFAQALRECRYLHRKRNIRPKEILLKNGSTTRNIRTDDIYYIESSNRKIIVSLREEKAECYGKISRMESELREGFFRIHKGYLINMKYVERYSRTEVQMKNGRSLLISKYKYQDFIKAYLKYISEDVE